MTKPSITPQPNRVSASERAITADSAEQLAALHRQQAVWRANDTTAEQRALALDRFYARAMGAADALLTSLTRTAIAIPIPKSARLQVRNVQQFLRVLAEDYQPGADAFPTPHGELGPHDQALWRGMRALAQHLLLSSLIAAPGAVGVWRQLHQLYACAQAAGIADYADPTGEDAKTTIHNVYFSAVLLGCAQPASFTSPEIAFIAAYLARHADQIELIDDGKRADSATFWIDPHGDAPACACARKTAPPQTPVLHFSCSRLAARITREIAELNRGIAARELGLHEFADSPAGRLVMRRLALYWGEPSKRRFPRRRQNYRARMCSGLGRLWRLFQEDDPDVSDASNWMITNESPDGYAFMHVSGKTGSLSVGEIVAIRTESGTSWQVCIVRWALSENQEHLELGLQILATRAQPARLGLAAKDDNNPTLLSALILPPIGALRTSEVLVIPASAIRRLPAKLILVIEAGNVELREVRCRRIDEQNGKIALLSIEADPLPR